MSPNNRAAASKAILRTFSAVKGCTTHPMLACSELSDIFGLTVETASFTAEYLQQQWTSQNCTTVVSSCQELSDAYDLPKGEWSRYAPKGVRAQFAALGCSTSPMPTCQALSDRYFINHAQIDPTLPSDAGVASQLILAKYSRWNCHHSFRDCQTLSNLWGIGKDSTTGKLTMNTLVPAWAKAIFKFRKCGTSPIAGEVPGVVPTPVV